MVLVLFQRSNINPFLQTQIVANEGDAELAAWHDNLSDACQRLATKKISQLQWLSLVEMLYALTPLEELHKWLDLQQIRQELSRQSQAVQGPCSNTMLINHFKPAQAPVSAATGCAISYEIMHLKNGHSVPPHGHRNLVAASFVISGKIHVRQYHKIEEWSEGCVLLQTGDEVQQMGRISTISDAWNNVHWLTAKSEDCLVFTTKLAPLDGRQPVDESIFLDLNAATDFDINVICVPKLDAELASHRYGFVA